MSFSSPIENIVLKENTVDVYNDDGFLFFIETSRKI